jgi:hypothetical protein
VTTIQTPTQWADAVLGYANLPTTADDTDDILRWMVGEEPPSDWANNNNPLNINAGGTGSDTFPSLDASAQETAAYLGMSNYAGIYSVLASGGDPTAFSAAVVASPWASGHYGGDPSYFLGISPTEEDANAPLGSPGSSATLTSSPAPGGALDPLNWFLDPGGTLGGVAGSAASSVWSEIEPFLATAVVVVAGLALIVLGFYKAASPSVRGALDQIPAGGAGGAPGQSEAPPSSSGAGGAETLAVAA